ncbi:hypothetical protein VYU27_000863 [Nannochloropsis oceanica]
MVRRLSPTRLPFLSMHVLLLLILAVSTASFVPPSSSFSSTSFSTSSCACDHHNRGKFKKMNRASSSSNTTAVLASSSSSPSHSSPSSSREATKTCRACLQQYKSSENGPTACHHHPGIYTGRLARIDDVDPTGAKDWFWSCCGEEREHRGCTQDYHRSFDDPPGPWRSGFQ